jgi:long-chain acyl-CoA synthetase
MNHRRWLAHYPPGVPHSLEPYPETSLYSILAEAADRHPNAPSWVFVVPGAPISKRSTYGETLAEVEQFSRALASLGVRKGDRVALVLPNCPQYLIGYYATLRLGAVVVGTNPLYTEREMSHQLRDAGAEVAVVLDLLYPTVAAVRDQTALREVIVTRAADYMAFPVNLLAPLKLKKEARAAGEPWPPVSAGARVRWWRDLMRSSFPSVPEAEIEPKKDLAGLIYTGGTTGLSKGAMLTHFNLLTNVIQGVSWFPDLRDAQESGLCLMPFFHSLGMTVAMNVGIKVAAKGVLQPKPDMATSLKAIVKERVTLLPGVPRLYIAINEDPATPRHDLSSIRACFSGAAPLPLAVAEKFERITGGTIVEGYGLTETSPITHGNPVRGIRKPGTIGLPMPDTDCRIVDVDDWTRELDTGQEGELIINGPQVMQGYWNRPEETDAVLKTDREGRRWLLTGDIARVDEDGYFSIVDRKKDLILVSGFNVYPTEIEQVLYRHPAIEKVCVAAIPDSTTGEAVKAFVVLKKGQTATAEDILEFCRDPQFGLTGYRVPKVIEFRDALPETLSGKVLRRVLQEEEGTANLTTHA